MKFEPNRLNENEALLVAIPRDELKKMLNHFACSLSWLTDLSLLSPMLSVAAQVPKQFHREFVVRRIAVNKLVEFHT